MHGHRVVVVDAEAAAREVQQPARQVRAVELVVAAGAVGHEERAAAVGVAHAPDLAADEVERLVPARSARSAPRRAPRRAAAGAAAVGVVLTPQVGAASRAGDAAAGEASSSGRSSASSRVMTPSSTCATSRQRATAVVRGAADPNRCPPRPIGGPTRVRSCGDGLADADAGTGTRLAHRCGHLLRRGDVGILQGRAEGHRHVRRGHEADRATQRLEGLGGHEPGDVGGQRAARVGLVHDDQVPGLADRAEDGVEVERRHRARVDDLGRHALLRQPIGRLERGVHHLLDAHDGHVAALTHDLGHTEGDGVGLLGHGPLSHVQPLVLDEDDRVGVADGLDQHALGVVGRRGRHDLQAGHVRVQRVERLRVLRAGAEAGTGDGAHDHGDGALATVEVAHLGGLVEELVEGGADEVDVHDLRHRSQPGVGRTDRGTDEAGLGDGGVDDALTSDTSGSRPLVTPNGPPQASAASGCSSSRPAPPAMSSPKMTTRSSAAISCMSASLMASLMLSERVIGLPPARSCTRLRSCLRCWARRPRGRQPRPRRRRAGVLVDGVELGCVDVRGHRPAEEVQRVLGPPALDLEGRLVGLRVALVLATVAVASWPR